MKSKLLLAMSFMAALFCNQANAQLGTWKYQNPSPGPNGQNALKVVSADTVYVGGWSGYVSRTFNGGATWVDCTPPSSDGVGALEFVNGLTGFASGETGKLYKTTNGGTSWTTISLPNLTWYVGDLIFLNQNVGFMGGFTYGSNGDSTYVAKTTDGGLTWTDMPNLKRFPSGIGRIQAFSSDTIMVFGWGSDYDGTMFTCSHDGGATWRNVLEMPNVGSGNYNQGTMYFLNSNEGYLYCTTPDTILKTTDGGLTWQNGGTLTLSGGTDFFLNTMHYFDANNAVAFASYGANPVYTTDGGNTWTDATHAANTSWIYSMKFVKNSLVGYANGGGGEVLKTVDGGKNWLSVQSPLRSTQWGVDFVDNQNGFTCGNNGSIYKTTNGGVSFSALTSGVTDRLTSIQKVRNTQTLYTCGFNGTILKSTNDGSNWTVQTSGTTKSLNSIYFLDTNNGIAVGDSGTVLKTVNGGTTWNSVNIGSTAKLNRVKIKGVNVYIASDTLSFTSGVFYKSHDSGNTFSAITINDFPESYFGLTFINDSTGYMCGTNGTIIKTTTYGQTWIQNLTNTTDEFFDIEFADAQRGIAVGNYGLIYETSDGGQTWEHNVCVVSVALYDVSYPDINNAWGVGRVGAVAKYTNNFSILSINDVSSIYGNLKLYPNPTNGIVTIISDEKVRNIELYNHVGMLINDTTLNENELTYRFPENLSEGLYFIKLSGVNGSITQRVILTK
jgi:photosystem II stability/assembly factor-like uncharacterized protein